MNVITINFCLIALIEKGWIKMGNFSKNTDKLSCAHLLTPTVAAEKATLTKRLLQRKMTDYKKLHEKIWLLRHEAQMQTLATLKS